MPLVILKLTLELKNCELGLEPESFNGLRKHPQTLEIISGIVTPKPNLFESINSLTHLALSINFQNNDFKKSLSGLKNLISLSIFNTSFPSSTLNTLYNVAPTIKSLELYGNNIDKIEMSTFATFKKLEILSIVEDNLLNLEPGAFNGLMSLENLTISRQKLTTIKKNTFVNLPKLKNLKITFNLINNIEMNSFIGLNLQTLDLSNNALIFIISQSFYSLQIDEFILAENPIIDIEKNAFIGSSINDINFINTSLRVFAENSWGHVSKHTYLRFK